MIPMGEFSSLGSWTIESTLESDNQALEQQDVFSVRFQCSSMSEPMTSLSDVWIQLTLSYQRLSQLTDGEIAIVNVCLLVITHHCDVCHNFAFSQL